MTAELAGTVVSVRYRSDDTGWTILNLRRADLFSSNVTAVGTLNPEPFPEEELVLLGTWDRHPKYGEQFKIERVQGRKSPVTLEGLAAYLGSGLFPGIGEAMAGRIVAQFGVETPDIITNTPERLAEVKGITEEKATAIAEVWKAEEAAREVMTWLCGLGLTTNMATRIYNTYEQQTIDKVKDNPYRLAWDVDGIGFRRADEIARSVMQLGDADPRRIEAGILHALKEAQSEGHVYLPRQELLTKAAELLRIDAKEAIDASLTEMAGRDERHGAAVVVEGTAVYLPSMHRAETGVAERLAALLDEPDGLVKVEPGEVSELVAGAAEAMGVTLSEQQRDAVAMVLSSKASVITGGPGTGKSMILKAVIHALDKAGAKYTLCAPTGRAAKRMAEATRSEAMTIHRTLEFQAGRGGMGSFNRHDRNPLKTDMLIVDEMSMVDLSLFHSLLKAMTSDMRLLLVGDVDQLPSVGAGDVLRDLIDSGRIPVTRLTKIFRQDARSKIVTNAHAINNGMMPDTTNDSTDFFFFAADTAAQIEDLIVDIVTRRLPDKFPEFNMVRDVQVLSPMYRGDAGVNALNQRLQAILNPPAPDKAEYRAKTRLYRVGDKVMQLSNNYDKSVFNGDVGFVAAIDNTFKQIVIDVDGRQVWYEFNELDQTTLAYAATVHKSQGSEYPVIVMPVTTSQYMMLRKNLIYTGVTRGKRTVVLVGSRKAIGIAVSNNTAEKRYTALSRRLQHG